MKKHIALIAVVVLASFAISGIAMAGADVQKLVPYPEAGPIDPDASGKAVLNQPKGAVCFQVTVSAKNLEPETVYTVHIKGLISGWQVIGTFETNKNGNGHFHMNYREDPPEPGAVAINNPDGKTVLIDEDYE